MPEYPITDIAVKEEKPAQPGQSGWKGKGATIYIYTVEGDPRRPEDFVVKGDQPKKVGDTVEIEDGDYGPRVKKAPRGGSGGGFKRSPTETKAIQRQHSQEQALRREANIIAAGGGPYTREQLKRVINFFERDIAEKDRATEWDGFGDDVPVDLSDTPFGGSA